MTTRRSRALPVGPAMSGGRRALALALVGGMALVTAEAQAAQFEIMPGVENLKAVQATTLPEGPHPPEEDDNCSATRMAPATAAGRHVAARGWGVTSERADGPFVMVAFGGKFIPGTSGSCAIEQGNVALFEGDRLRAILYTRAATDRLIGSFEALDGGAVRLWDGDFLISPVADLAVAADTVEVRPLPAEDPVCGGAATVPNVFGLPITEARKKLLAARWEPVPQPLEEFGIQKDLQALGVVEAETCSGTGFGFCSYLYRQPGMGLSLSTSGDLYEDQVPKVVGYGVDCGRAD